MNFFSRFVTELYSTCDGDIDNMFIHLTNYSINKGSELFEQNIDPEDAQVRRMDLITYLFSCSLVSGLQMDINQPLEVLV